jgi:hypothetical protein
LRHLPTHPQAKQQERPEHAQRTAGNTNPRTGLLRSLRSAVSPSSSRRRGLLSARTATDTISSVVNSSLILLVILVRRASLLERQGAPIVSSEVGKPRAPDPPQKRKRGRQRLLRAQAVL